MKLRKICEEIEYTLLQGSLETEVRDIIYDSRKIAPETMFVCMVGAVTDGHKYIPDAVEKGASVIVLEKEEEAAQIPEKITVLKVESARLALALMQWWGKNIFRPKTRHRNPTNYTACLLPWWKLAVNMWSWKFLPRG